MHIGVVTTSYPRRAGDPAGSFVEGHVRALRAAGHDVEVIAAGERDATADPGASRDVNASLDTEPHRIASPLFYRGGAPDLLERAPVAHAIAAASFTARLAATVARRSRRWDLIVAHWLAPSAIAALPLRLPLVAIAHGGDIHTLRRVHLLGPVLRALELRGARLVFVSEQLRSLARAASPRYVDAALVQPMGLDLAHFAALARAPVTPPTILVAARLQPIKGVDVAIAARAHVETDAHLVIAGAGPARAALEAATDREARLRRREALRRNDRDATFLGEVDTAERDRLLSQASVVVVPSRATATGRTEGTPMIALEALAAGVPVVASAVGGLRELAGIVLVPPDDPYELGRAIDRTLASPASPSTLRAAVAHLDWKHVAERLLRRE